jgi:hypothetical protein
MDKSSSLFQLDMRMPVKRARRFLGKRIEGVSLNLPFVSISVRPDDIERRVAREIVIRLADKRVLNARECCDKCVDGALASLQEVRSFLVDKQVELGNLADGPLYLIIEFMLEGVRQFLTFQERLGARSNCSFPRGHHRDYFHALELIRGHVYRCLVEVSKIAEIQIPRIADHMRYDTPWQLLGYTTLDEANGMNAQPLPEPGREAG